MSVKDKGGTRVFISESNFWRYDEPPRGAKIFLLTKGGVTVIGNWTDDGRYIAWQSLFKRDHAIEDQKGIS